MGTASSSVPWIVSSPGLWAWLSCSLVAYSVLRLGALSLPSPSFARASGCPLEGPTIFGSCYIPCSGPARRVAKLALEAELTYLRARFPTTPVCVLGDFNHDSGALDCLLVFKFGCSVVRNPGKGNMASRHVRGRACKRAVDHVLISVEHQSMLRRSHVDRTFDLSDHWGVTASWRLHSLPVGAAIDVEVSEEEPWVFVRSDKWQAVLEQGTGGGLSICCRVRLSEWAICRAGVRGWGWRRERPSGSPPGCACLCCCVQPIRPPCGRVRPAACP